MRIFPRLLGFFLLTTVLVGASGCCCLDSEVFEQYTESMGDDLEKKLEVEMEAQAKKMEAEIAKAEAAAAAQPVVEVKPKPVAKPTAKLKAPPIEGDRSGKFKDTKLKKKGLTGGSLKLVVDDRPKMMSGTFLGQYDRKPFSVNLDGGISATDDTFKLEGKDGKGTKLVVKGTHKGDTLVGKINGKLRGKAIDAKFIATRHK